MCKQVGRWLQALGAAALVAMLAPAQAVESLRIVTEEFPPYNMTQGGKITGMSTEVVEAVLKEIKLTGSIQSMPWARAYDTAMNTENVLIYSITRIPAREALFKWVGVIAPAERYLFSLQGKNLKLHHLEDARLYQIATVNQDAGEQYLVTKGFVIGQNLQSSAKHEVNYEKLKLGRVDLWIANGLVAAHLSRQAGDDPAKVLTKAHLLTDLGNEGTYMAFGTKTPDALVERFRRGLETIKKNGTFDTIRRKWL